MATCVSKGYKRTISLVGQTFGRLTVIEHFVEFYGSQRHGHSRCKCSCGKEVIALNQSLRAGLKKSCGCLHAVAIGDRTRTHGESNSPLYRVWRFMLRRCYSPTMYGYERYGGHGIKVCRQWRSFQVFAAWARANGYTDGMSLGRIDQDKDFSPQNCIWRQKYSRDVKKK